MTNNKMSYDLASEMERIFNSDEHKEIFGTAKNIEKVAFSRVSDEDKLTSEIEIDLLATAEKEKCCECASKEGKGKDCKCECHPKESKESKEDKKEASTVEKLLAVSEELDGMGFERLAGMALKFAGLVVEAKAKKSDKKSSKKSEKDKKAEKEKAKAKADKEKAKAKKEKAEKAKADKEKAEKAKAKASKKSAGYAARMKLGQQVSMPGDPVVDYSGSKGPARTSEVPPAHLAPNSVHGNDADLIKAALPPQVLASIVSLEAGPLPSGGGQVSVKLKEGPGADAAFKSVQSIVQQLQNANKLSAAPYKVVGA